MSQNFAPYQDTAPDVTRSLSPPPQSPSPRISSPKLQTQHIPGPRNVLSPPTSPSYQNGGADYFNPAIAWDNNQDAEANQPQTRSGGAFWSQRSGIDLYETSLGLRLDWEACLAYLAFPPAGAAVLLMFEHRSDYVRFHAWQSALLFSVLFILHVIFSWSSVLSWIIFAGDMFLIGLLTLRAYKDAETLDRFEIPLFGTIANSILNDE